MQELSKHLESVKTWNPQQANADEIFFYIDLSSVDKDKKVIDTTQVHQILAIEAPSRARQIVKKSDILVSTVRPNLNGVATVPNELNDATASTGYCVLRANNQTLNAQYLFYWVQTKSFINEMVSKATGANYPAVSDKIIKQSKIPLPPLAEQQKIAAILDAADSLRQKDQQLVERYTTLSQSLFLEMFDDPVTNPMGWDIHLLGNMISYLTSGSRGWAQYYSDTGDVFLRIQNIGKNKLILNDITFVNAPINAEAKRTKIEAGDILLSITADLGRTAVIPENFPTAYINQHLAIIRLKDNYLPFFVSQFISSIGGERQLLKLDKGGVKAGLNFDDIKSLKIINPPIALQNQFIERIKLIEAQTQQAQASLLKSEALFNSLLQQAFTGELTRPPMERAA